tara:strand:+ start:1541 stop:1807 length:267 start_codon:yes stop_codon:yes gene_type:complete
MLETMGAMFAKQALGVMMKRKQNRGSAFSQMKIPQVKVVSRVANVSSGTKSRPVRASGSTMAKNQSMVSNVSGKGFKVKTAVSGLIGS